MRRAGVFAAVVTVVALLLFGVPWLVLVMAPDWPAAVTIAGSVVVVVLLGTLLTGMRFGHGKPANDFAARVGDTTLGSVWVLFTWSVLGAVVMGVLGLAGVPHAGRWSAGGVLVVVVALLALGNYEAMRVPAVRATDVVLPGLGAGFDGVKVAVIADTHFGPINRTAWGKALVDRVNELQPDIVCHAGDLADGTVERRRDQVAALGKVDAPLGRYYITGNHEYFSDGQQWLDHMATLGWEPMHNRHVVLTRDGATLVMAGIDDPTGLGSGLPGHGPDLAAALAAAPSAPVILLAHQPKQVRFAAEAGVALQLSGHTHGGQIWPFHYLVRLDQKFVRGLHSLGSTQLYTSGGAGFWGPPFRVFARSEISLLTLRAG
ncbi:metallophosphoesterase [Labedaea rhizosphaerae]|uniref:Calcineurin-like phosphoesterase domain-containing protein n=1 Tax=Labedaea rhizosphaerae TaxID=598644 RepID=A0A4V3CYQ0_LABRH|nr:metallophosphoesterase [Labedaea rhizosphaerae]TDP94988.1 hypothetical protein EV186_105220 [Labedaea rhizosphaerae]